MTIPPDKERFLEEATEEVTQIQEQALTLVPKIFVMTLVAILLMRWIADRLAEFTIEMFQLI